MSQTPSRRSLLGIIAAATTATNSPGAAIAPTDDPFAELPQVQALFEYRAIPKEAGKDRPHTPEEWKALHRFEDAAMLAEAVRIARAVATHYPQLITGPVPEWLKQVHDDYAKGQQCQPLDDSWDGSLNFLEPDYEPEGPDCP